MTTTAAPDATDVDVDGLAAPPWRQHAVQAFAVLAAAAVPILLHVGRHQWFRYDDWDFLASRELSVPSDLLEPHNVHWTTLPIVAYRALWALVGARSYVPYQLVNILAHVAVASLLLVVMRRSGVRPWTAAAAAALVLFLGSGDENIVWAFQITFNGALAFGLVHLLLADHDGPVARRDWLGLAAGLAGLLCSGAAIAMVAIVGVAVLLRRGARPALFHTVPLVTSYGLWYVLVSQDAYEQPHTTSFADTWDLFSELVRAAGLGIGRTPVLAWLLGGLLIGGLWVAWRGRTDVGVRRRGAAPAGLLAGSLAFLVLTAAGRAGRVSDVTANNRYVYVSVVLFMPALALAADVLMRRWRPLTGVIAALAVVAAVGNVGDLGDDDPAAVQFARDYRVNLLSMPRVPRAAEIPRGLHPDLALAPWVSFGWLRDGVERGRLPAPHARDPAAEALTEGTLVLRLQAHQPRVCENLPLPAELELRAGTSIETAAPITFEYVSGNGVVAPLSFSPGGRRRSIVSYVDGVTVRIESAGSRAVRLCDPEGGAFVVTGGP